MSDGAMQTPLIEQLQSVPGDARGWYENSPTGHNHIPYGRLCAEAAERIAELVAENEDLKEHLRQLDQYPEDAEEQEHE